MIRLLLIRLELLTALDALIEGDEGMFDGGWRAKHLGVFEEHLAGVRIDLDIGHQLWSGSPRFQFLHEGFDLCGLFFDFRELFRFGLDGRRSALASTAAARGRCWCRSGCWWRGCLRDCRLKSQRQHDGCR